MGIDEVHTARYNLSMNTMTTKVILPVRIAAGWPLRIKDGSNGDGGWSTIACTVEEARRIIAEYPTAAMPCWRNPKAEWNR